MMYLRSSWRALVMVVALFLCSDEATAQAFADFVGASGVSPITGITSNVSDLGSYQAQWIETDCGEHQVMRWRKGGNAIPWSTEVHWLNGEFWDNAAELKYDDSGSVSAYRVFRENQSGMKGLRRFRAYLQAENPIVQLPVYTEEEWGDYFTQHCFWVHNGERECVITGVHPSCNGQVNIPYLGVGTATHAEYLPRSASGFSVYDQRFQGRKWHT